MSRLFPSSSPALALLAALLVASRAFAAPPRYDHVVIVIEENHAYSQIIGNTASAPYINALASQGVSFTNYFAVTHPSQPNYLHLFSGSAQGVTSVSKPSVVPFSTANLGAELRAAGFTFTGFSENLPAVGDTTTITTTDASGNILYARKHSPWSNWQDATVPTPANRLPASVNQPFTSFPTDFTTLPTVAIVVPNQQHDMHDGSIKMADDWLSAHLAAYAAWAPAHNSLLIVTWDEDDFSTANRIATIFSGAALKAGAGTATWTHHNLLRTIEDMYGTAHAGSAANVAPISGVFADETVGTTLAWQQGVGGYAGSVDTQIRSAAATTSYGATNALAVDLDDTTTAGNQPAQSLLRFDGIIGAGAGQVPPGAQILSAKIGITTGSGANDPTVGGVELHRMIAAWSAASTWSSVGGGVAANNVTAAAAADFTLIPSAVGARVIFDATASVQHWANGEANNGWALLPTNADGWMWLSSETTTATARPRLEVTYTLPSAQTFDTWRVAKFGANANSPIAAPDADPDGDGVANLLEYALGADPLSSASRNLPSLVPGAYLTISFSRVTAASDLTYTVQVSSDLLTWLDGSTYSATSSTPANANTTEVSRAGIGIETIVVRDNTPVAGTAQRSIRLRVTRP